MNCRGDVSSYITAWQLGGAAIMIIITKSGDESTNAYNTYCRKDKLEKKDEEEIIIIKLEKKSKKKHTQQNI